MYAQYSTAGSSMTEIASPNLAIALNVWHHVAFVWELGKISLYFNGALVTSSGAIGTQNLFSSTSPLRIGADASGNYFDGHIDDFRWSNVVRSLAVPTAPHAID